MKIGVSELFTFLKALEVVKQMPTDYQSIDNLFKAAREKDPAHCPTTAQFNVSIKRVIAFGERIQNCETEIKA